MFGQKPDENSLSSWDLEHGNGFTPAEAMAEVARELNVRTKCYDRWVAEKKMTRTEAELRLGSMIRAYQIVAGDQLDSRLSSPVIKTDDMTKPY